jgi:hypothetical protein
MKNVNLLIIQLKNLNVVILLRNTLIIKKEVHLIYKLQEYMPSC